MDVVMISPGHPAEMPRFARALAAQGARVVGVGDQPVSSLPAMAQEALARYVQISSFADEERAVEEVLSALRGSNVDRVESMWEVSMYLGARLRERIGVPGLTVADTVKYRDKEVMKQVVRDAGLRVARSARASTVAEVWAAAEAIGYPLIVKPIAGAGSMDTFRVGDVGELRAVLPALRAVPEVSVEEFIDGEEFTFDAIAVGGSVAYHNVCWYRPNPLVQKQLEWVSPQSVALREPDGAFTGAGSRLGFAVLEAMGFGDGFAHMEWFLKPDGEVVFGEIGARVGGARLADTMNYACDIDVYRGWAETVVHGSFSEPVERRYNAATIYKRAQGHGHIQRIEGLGRLVEEWGHWIVDIDLLPVGAPRRDWRATVLSDGTVTVRHPDLDTLLHLADQVGTDVRLYAW